MGTPAQTLQSERLKYPGLLPREIIIFREWLRLHERDFDRFDYNVRVGDGFDPGPGFSPDVRQQAIENSKKRIDAIAWQGSAVTLIEVKDRAGLSAIGQLIGYRPLWQQTVSDFLSGRRTDFDEDWKVEITRRRPATVPPLLLVTNRAQPDLGVVVESAGIRLNLVDVLFTELHP
ncbi:MAG: hypothetical protein ACRD2K_05400, partial [Terriglobales bacterium]